LSARLVRKLATATTVAAAVTLGAATPAYAAAPANNDIAFAQFLPGPTNSISGSNIDATAEKLEPQHVAGHPPAHSVWYKWTAPADGRFIFRTQGSNFNTVLAVYQGTGFDRLIKVTDNDDTPLPDGSTKQSQVTFGARAGTEFRIAVDGLTSTEVGQVKLSWTSNDDFAAAQTLPTPALGAFATVGGSNTGATVQSGEGGTGPVESVASSTVWYTWTAPVTARTEFTTLATSFGSALTVYTGDSLGALTTVASAAGNFSTTGGSQVSFTAKAGTTYRIAVGGLPTRTSPLTQGKFVLRVQQFGPRISVGDVSVTEGNSGTKTLAFPVTLSEAAAAPVTVSFATANGTATGGSDFVTKTGTLTIPAGVTSGTIAVTVNGDTVKEATEQFTLTLSNPTGAATFTDRSAVGTITNDDV
jgi:hypothetical protein